MDGLPSITQLSHTQGPVPSARRPAPPVQLAYEIPVTPPTSSGSKATAEQHGPQPALQVARLCYAMQEDAARERGGIGSLSVHLSQQR